MTTQDPTVQDSDNITDSKTIEQTLEQIVDEHQDDIHTDTIPPSPESLDSLVEEIARLKDALARSQADYKNLSMRNERDKEEMVSFLLLKLITPLLTIVDNLERAVKLKEGSEGDAFVDGVRSVLSSMNKYLESHKVQSFSSLGEEVDPNRHDVMTQGPGPEGKIISEIEKGYMIGDRVLRHAKVIVGSGE